MLIMNTFLLLICSELVISLPHSSLLPIDIVNSTEANNGNYHQSSLAPVNETLPKKDTFENVSGKIKKRQRRHDKDVENHVTDEKGTRTSIEDDKRRRQDIWKDTNERDEKGAVATVEDDKQKHGKWKTEINYHIKDEKGARASMEDEKQKRHDNWKEQQDGPPGDEDFIKKSSNENPIIHNEKGWNKDRHRDPRRIDGPRKSPRGELRTNEDQNNRIDKKWNNHEMDPVKLHGLPSYESDTNPEFHKKRKDDNEIHEEDETRRSYTKQNDRKQPSELQQRHTDGYKHRKKTSRGNEYLNNDNKVNTLDNNLETNLLHHESVGGDRNTFKDDSRPQNDDKGNEFEHIKDERGARASMEDKKRKRNDKWKEQRDGRNAEVSRHGHEYKKKAFRKDGNFVNVKNSNSKKDHEIDPLSSHESLRGKEPNISTDETNLQNRIDELERNTELQDLNNIYQPGKRTLEEGVDDLETDMFFQHELDGKERTTSKEDNPRKDIKILRNEQHHAESPDRHKHDYGNMKDTSKEEENLKNIDKHTVPQNPHSNEKINEEIKTFREDPIHRHKKWESNENQHDTDVDKVRKSSSEIRNYQKESRRKEDQNDRKHERKSITSIEDAKNHNKDAWAKEDKKHAVETDDRNKKVVSDGIKHDYENQWNEEPDHVLDENKITSHENGQQENEIYEDANNNKSWERKRSSWEDSLNRNKEIWNDEETRVKKNTVIDDKNKKATITEKKHRLYKNIINEKTHSEAKSSKSSNENQTHRKKKMTKVKENNAESRSTRNHSTKRSRQKSTPNDSERGSSKEGKNKWQEDLDNNSIDNNGPLDDENRKSASKERKWDDDENNRDIRSEKGHERKRRYDDRGDYDSMHYNQPPMMDIANVYNRRPPDEYNNRIPQDDYNRPPFDSYRASDNNQNDYKQEYGRSDPYRSQNEGDRTENEFDGPRIGFGTGPNDYRNEENVPVEDNNRPLGEYKISANAYERPPYDYERNADEARRSDARRPEDTRYPNENSYPEQQQYNNNENYETEHERENNPRHSVVQEDYSAGSQGKVLPQLTDETLPTQKTKRFRLFHNNFFGRIRQRISAKIRRFLG